MIRNRIYIPLLLVVGLSFFYKTLYFGFLNTDDPIHIAENIALLTFDLKGLLTKFYIGLYHPLTTLSFATDWWLGGGKPWLFHLSNVVFHILGSIVLFKVSLKLWPNRFFLGFLISLAFMLHPLKVESVAWVTERKDVLSGLFLWLTVYLYLFYLDHEKKRFYLLSNLAFLFSVASKVSVVPLPIFLLVIDWYKNKNFTFKSLTNKIPFFIISLIFGLLNVLEQSRIRIGMVFPEKHYTDLFYQIHFYIEKFIFPWSLRAWYSPQYLNFNLPGIVAIALLCGLAILIVKYSTERRSDLILGWSFFIIFLFPNIKIMTPGDANIVNDRYMYIALTGLTFAFFPSILQALESLWRQRRRVFSVALSGIFAALIIQWLLLSHMQIPYWKEPITLWRHTAKFEPHSKVVAGNLGRALLIDRRYIEAIDYLQKAQGEVSDFVDLAYGLTQLPRLDLAEKIVKNGLKVYPEHPALLNMFGVVKLGMKQHQGALSLFAKALGNLRNEQSPRLRAIILNHMGLANIELERHEVAISFFEEALALYKNDSKILYNLGLCLIKLNRTEEAKGVFLRVVAIDPSRAEAYNNLAVISSREKNFGEARDWLHKALKVDPGFKHAMINLKAIDNKGLVEN